MFINFWLERQKAGRGERLRRKRIGTWHSPWKSEQVWGATLLGCLSPAPPPQQQLCSLRHSQAMKCVSVQEKGAQRNRAIKPLGGSDGSTLSLFLFPFSNRCISKTIFPPCVLCCSWKEKHLKSCPWDSGVDRGKRPSVFLVLHVRTIHGHSLIQGQLPDIYHLAESFEGWRETKDHPVSAFFVPRGKEAFPAKAGGRLFPLAGEALGLQTAEPAPQIGQLSSGDWPWIEETWSKSRQL